MRKFLQSLHIFVLFFLIFLNNYFIIYGLMFFLFISMIFYNLKFKPILFLYIIPIFIIEIFRIIFYQEFDLDFFNLIFILIISYIFANKFKNNNFIFILSTLIIFFSFFSFQLLQDFIPYSGNHFVRIIILALFLINFEKKSFFIEFLSLFILLHFSILSSSRSGILVSIICILVYLILFFIKKNILRFLFITTAAFIFFLIFNNISISVENIPNDLINPDLALKLTNEGVSSAGRENILFFINNELRFSSLLIGFPNHFIYNNFGFESHNSFIELFSYYGIFILILFIFISIYVAFLLIKYEYLMLFIFFLFILLRSIFDNFLFINNFDFTFIYFVCLLQSFNIKTNNNLNK